MTSVTVDIQRNGLIVTDAITEEQQQAITDNHAHLLAAAFVLWGGMRPTGLERGALLCVPGIDEDVPWNRVDTVVTVILSLLALALVFLLAVKTGAL